MLIIDFPLNLSTGKLQVAVRCLLQILLQQLALTFFFLSVKRDQVSDSPGKPFLVPGKSQTCSRVRSLVKTCQDGVSSAVTNAFVFVKWLNEQQNVAHRS